MTKDSDPEVWCDSPILYALTSAGISRELALKACDETGNSGASAALRWAMDHLKNEAQRVDDSDIVGSDGNCMPGLQNSQRKQTPRFRGFSKKKSTAVIKYDENKDTIDIPKSNNSKRLTPPKFVSPLKKKTEGEDKVTCATIWTAEESHALGSGLGIHPRRLARPKLTEISPAKRANQHSKTIKRCVMQQIERPDSSFSTSSTAITEMRLLRSELTQLRNELKRSHFGRPAGLPSGLGKMRSGMLYGGQVIALDMVD